LKLIFKTQKTVNFDRETIREKAIRFLQKRDYNITKTTTTLIAFNNEAKSWRSVPYSAYYSTIDEGQFEFAENNGQSDIHLVFRVSITIEIIELLIIIIATICVDYRALFLAIIFILNFVAKVQNIRNNFIKNIERIDSQKTE